MNITLLAAESMGVRSMALCIDSDGQRILIDPGAALAPSRFGLPPHPQEERALEQALERICRYAPEAHYLVITHYHFDHYLPQADVYREKTVFAKSIRHHINQSQKQRGTAFARQWNEKCVLTYADGQTFELGDTMLRFSPPFPHGPPGTRLGYALAVTVEGDQRVVYTSDLQGPVDAAAAHYLIEQQPDLLIADGPPTYLLGYRFSRQALEQAERHLLDIMTGTKCHLILDHHLLRDLAYEERLPTLYGTYGHRIQTYAQYNGQNNNLLEARRQHLWSSD